MITYKYMYKYNLIESLIKTCVIGPHFQIIAYYYSIVIRSCSIHYISCIILTFDHTTGRVSPQTIYHIQYIRCDHNVL